MVEATEDGWRAVHDDHASILQPLALADFDHDGLEDALVFWLTGPADGTLRFGGLGLLQRLDDDSALKFSAKIAK